MDPEELILAVVVAVIPCVLFDHTLSTFQRWQSRRAGIVETHGLGLVGRTILSLLINSATCGLIAYVYRTIGHIPRDAFVIGASIWLMVAVPILFTSRYVDDTAKRNLAGRILGWLGKTAIAATSAAFFITFKS